MLQVGKAVSLLLKLQTFHICHSLVVDTLQSPKVQPSLQTCNPSSTRKPSRGKKDK